MNLHRDDKVRKPADLVRFRSFLYDQWNPLTGPYTRVLLEHENQGLALRDTSFGTSRLQRMNLEESQLWWVGAEMMDLIFTAAETTPEDLTAFDLPLPSRCGVVYFEKPWVGLDAGIDGIEIEVSAITWGDESYIGGDEGLMCSSYCALKMGPDMPEHQSSYAQFSGLLGEDVRQAIHERRAIFPANELSGNSYIYLGRSSWRWDEELGHQPPDLDELAWKSTLEDRRLLAVFFNMLRIEAIAETTKTFAPRAVRRDAERKGVQKNISDISVINLRRREHVESEGDADVSSGDSRFSHRWYVDPFVRWQRVGPGRTERRLVQVQGHVKGPEDKPFKAKTKVRALRR